MSSKVAICNLGLSRLGNYGSLENIDTPTKSAEAVFAKWWDFTRQLALKELIPNFAISRRKLAQDANTPAFGYSTQFAYPSDCLRLLGIGEAQYKENNHSIEGGYILTDDYSEDDDGNVYLPIRFIIDVTDTSKYTPEFVEALSWYLAYTTNMEITQDTDKQVYFEKVIGLKKSVASAMNAQENPPIRINNSKFKAARTTRNPVNYEKL